MENQCEGIAAIILIACPSAVIPLIEKCHRLDTGCLCYSVAQPCQPVVKTVANG